MRGSDRQSFLHLPRRKIYSIVTSKLGKRRKTVERPRLLPDAESRRAPRRRRRAALRWAGEASRAWMELVILLLHVLALPRGTVVVEASSQPLASGPPPMDGATPGNMPPPDYSHIPEEMRPSPGEASPLADVMAWHSQRTGQGIAAEPAHGMHGPSAQDVVTSASAGQAMTAAAPVGQMHSMPAPDFSAIPAGTPPPPRTSPVTRSPAFALTWFG